jgi:hypothetical protein
MYSRLLFFILFPFTVLANSNQTVELSKVMSLQEQQETGVYRLTFQEKQALEKWLTSWTIRLLNEGSGSDSAFFTNETLPPELNTVKRVFRNEGNIELSDGSLWKISPVDLFRASSWLPRDKIEIAKSQDLYYPYTLTNYSTKVSVGAQRLSGATFPTQENGTMSQNNPSQVEKPEAPPIWKPYGQIKITAVQGRGSFIALSDQSSWYIAPNDRYTVRNWYVGDSVSIQRDPKNTHPSYPYIINLNSTTTTVNAKPATPQPEEAMK